MRTHRTTRVRATHTQERVLRSEARPSPAAHSSRGGREMVESGGFPASRASGAFALAVPTACETRRDGGSGAKKSRESFSRRSSRRTRGPSMLAHGDEGRNPQQRRRRRVDAGWSRYSGPRPKRSGNLLLRPVATQRVSTSAWGAMPSGHSRAAIAAAETAAASRPPVNQPRRALCAIAPARRGGDEVRPESSRT